MKAQQNLWALMTMDGATIDTVVQADRPANADETGYAEWVPVYAEGRITGDRYQPYNGSSEWVQAANEAMASKANSNFRRGNGY